MVRRCVIYLFRGNSVVGCPSYVFNRAGCVRFRGQRRRREFGKRQAAVKSGDNMLHKREERASDYYLSRFSIERQSPRINFSMERRRRVPSQVIIASASSSAMCLG